MIRSDGAHTIRTKCTVGSDRELAEQIGINPGHVSRILSGKTPPGNRFIAGIIDRCGLKFAFDKVFEIVP